MIPSHTKQQKMWEFQVTAEKNGVSGVEEQLEFVVDGVKVGKKHKKRLFCGKVDMIWVPCLVSLCVLLWAQGKNPWIPSWDTWVDLILHAGG